MPSKPTLIRRIAQTRTLVRIKPLLQLKVHFGRYPDRVPANSIVFFPCRDNRLHCGLAGLVAVKPPKPVPADMDPAAIMHFVDTIEQNGYVACTSKDRDLADDYLGGSSHLNTLFATVKKLKTTPLFLEMLLNRNRRKTLQSMADRIAQTQRIEADRLAQEIGRLSTQDAAVMTQALETLNDVKWCIEKEIIDNIEKIVDLSRQPPTAENRSSMIIFKEINAVLNSIDRLEVRGRDSAGISILLQLAEADFDAFVQSLDRQALSGVFSKRTSQKMLSNGAISIHSGNDDRKHPSMALAFTFKVAAEIGRLGDNIAFIRNEIRNDPIFQLITGYPLLNHTISSHTRWASVGAITEANCHPVDNVADEADRPSCGIIHTCLNGDIDNFAALKEALTDKGISIPDTITTDTKIIPLQIEMYLRNGNSVEEAFRMAVSDFSGSHAISMHTDLAPGKLFLAQKGSGQAIFVGLAYDHYMAVSEVYGFIEETDTYVKLDGETMIQGKNGPSQGQIFILNQHSAGRIEDIRALYYDGTPLRLGPEDLKHTQITSRDIDRQHYPHYFLKEISESPASVEKTLQNRWKIDPADTDRYLTVLDESVIPDRLTQLLTDRAIRHIFFIGQGTAGVAAQACAGILNTYLNDKRLVIDALKASELSGSRLNEHDGSDSMADTLVIAISQSGTTTDTNRTIDMVRERGAKTLAIVNRRDSDITFKVDGVFYTSTGRDIEMSVASTKAFYSQIVAGALLGLHLALMTKRRGPDFVTRELKRLIKLPQQMKTVLDMQDRIKASAQRLAGQKIYWAAVGSGMNKASADEIRIKLSELCYKTISSDFVEDKKHIDLSSEPLIIVCAAGSKSTVIGDIKKDTAIFKAHKAATIVIADENESGFDAYADEVFHVPVVAEHLAPIVTTLVGHLWGYYAALSINEGSRFLHEFREALKTLVDDRAEQGLDVYEVVLEKSFREKVALFYQALRNKRQQKAFPIAIAQASDLILLLKYLSGRLPVSDFEIDFGIKGTALNILNALFETIGESINRMSRPIDAIKHQAKTVTVGTSRISEKVEGVLFDTLSSHGIRIDQLTHQHVIVLRNLQQIVSAIKGSILYQIDGLNVLGEPTEHTTIKVLRKGGVLKPIPSRVESDEQLKGTKRIIVKNGNVYIGKGRKDGRSILVIPAMSGDKNASNLIQFLLLLNISFRQQVPLGTKIKALGGKYDHIKNIVLENSLPWQDEYLDRVDMEELFGRSAEKIGEFIVAKA